MSENRCEIVRVASILRKIRPLTAGSLQAGKKAGSSNKASVMFIRQAFRPSIKMTVSLSLKR
ncbi:MAG: hypothetical protein IJ752_09060 [Alphaproteobacteria bacterium]|nr:hypothetical protein [Alphaproteobacteria bacterium]